MNKINGIPHFPSHADATSYAQAHGIPSHAVALSEDMPGYWVCGRAPANPFCRHPDECGDRGYCPREIACND